MGDVGRGMGERRERETRLDRDVTVERETRKGDKKEAREGD